MEYKPKTIEDSFDVFEPGIDSISTKYELRGGENETPDNSSLSSYKNDDSSNEPIASEKKKVLFGENCDETSHSTPKVKARKKSTRIEIKLLNDSSKTRRPQ